MAEVGAGPRGSPEHSKVAGSIPVVSTMQTHKTIQLRLLVSTFKRLDELEVMLEARSKTDAVGRAINIAQVIMRAVRDGKDIVIEGADGSRERLIVLGGN